VNSVISAIGEQVDLICQAKYLLAVAEARGIGLRLAGSAAFLLRCHPYSSHFAWPAPQDIDLVCSRTDAPSLATLFAKLGYENDRRLMISTEGRRWSLMAPVGLYAIDVFFDHMDFSHRLDLSGRITIDRETLTLADLFLCKLQYLAPRDQDIEQMVCLLSTSQFAPRDGDTINLNRICAVLANSWGYYYTATMNFDRLSRRLDISADSEARDRLMVLRRAIAEWPKGPFWKLRSYIGPKLKWYNDVDKSEVF
jgi:hypothetical protein